MKKITKKHICLIFKIIFPVFFVLSIVYPVFCFANNAGSNAFTFLQIGEGAKPVAMGEAYVALANDVNAIYWNPAGLGLVTQQEITASYLKYIVDINSGHFGYVRPMLAGGLGMGLTYLDYGKIKETTSENPIGESSGYYRPSNVAMIISYGRKINNRFSLGMNMKGIYENIQRYTANGIAVDLGTMYKVSLVKDLIVGFTVKNLGFQTKAFIEETYDLPLSFNFGLGYGLNSRFFKLGLNFCKPQNGDINVNVGGEYCWKELISLRIGHKSIGEDLKTGSSKDSLTGLSTGLGLNMKSYQLDYAFVPFNELGDTHRISLGMKFGKTRHQLQNTSQNIKIKKRKRVKHYKKGQKYCKEKSYEEAIREYKKAIKYGYRTAKVYANMGYCYHKLGKKIEAKRSYKKALKLEPNNKKIKKNLILVTKK
ncbi:PorV/PorQ family protein [bacterium]|nr:PorV/PorQ family protein [bacterium]